MVAFNNIIEIVALVAVFFASPSGRASACGTINAGPAASSSHAVSGQPITFPPMPAKPSTTLIISPACTVYDSLGHVCIGFCAAGGPLDPLFDACVGEAWAIMMQCLTCIASNYACR